MGSEGSEGAAQGYTVRRATEADAGPLLSLVEEVGWAYTREEVLRLVKVQPEGMILVESDGPLGGVVGCVYAPCWGRVGFIGLMLVRAKHRGRGLGRLLMLRALEHLDGSGCTLVGLDAVQDAVGFYEAFGFFPSWRSLRYTIDSSLVPGPESGTPAGWVEEGEVPAVVRLDRDRSGFERGSLLVRLARDDDATVAVLRSGHRITSYAVVRRSKGCYRLGPLVAGEANPYGMRGLALHCLASVRPALVTVSVPEYNADAVRLVTSLDAMPSAHCVRMYRGDPGGPVSPPDVWATGAAEKG